MWPEWRTTDVSIIIGERQGVQRDGYLLEGKFHDFVMMSLLEDRWREVRD